MLIVDLVFKTSNQSSFHVDTSRMSSTATRPGISKTSNAAPFKMRRVLVVIHQRFAVALMLITHLSDAKCDAQRPWSVDIVATSNAMNVERVTMLKVSVQTMADVTTLAADSTPLASIVANSSATAMHLATYVRSYAMFAVHTTNVEVNAVKLVHLVQSIAKEAVNTKGIAPCPVRSLAISCHVRFAAKRSSHAAINARQYVERTVPTRVIARNAVKERS